MGSPQSEPFRDRDELRHRVTISRPFFMQTTEVTQGQWKAVMGENPSKCRLCGDRCPVERITWNEAVKFCNRLSEMEGLEPAYRTERGRVKRNRVADGYRLPTEAEWEYACRAGTTSAFYTGPSRVRKCTLDAGLDRAAWYCANAEQSTHPVGGKRPNAWGLFDMHGNVYEWCWDAYGPYRPGSAGHAPGPTRDSWAVIRGGGWSNGASESRSANRESTSPDERSSNLGLRVCRPVR